MTKKWVVGAGAALVDIIIEESDEFLAKLGAEKGGMTLVTLDKIEAILKQSDSKVNIVPGGSACNTLVGIGHLGGQAHMLGRMGSDQLGEQFTDGLNRSGVKCNITHSASPTGRVLSIVTPDAQRTMFTYLGASAELSSEDIIAEALFKASIIHLEGYLLFNNPVIERIIDLKKQTKARLALDLASFEVVQACRPLIENLLDNKVDIIIANEDEAKAFTGLQEKEALLSLAKKAEIAVVKLGKKGALISQKGEITEVEAKLVHAFDTTGAGDLWASGFFYGLTHDFSMENCGRLAAMVASEVVQVMGASIPDEGWQRIIDFKNSLEV